MKVSVGWIIFVSVIVLTSCSPKVAAPSSSARISEEISAGLLGNWEQLGIQKGQPVPDFTLHSEKGKTFSLKDELSKGKPVVLISGSYTCDVSRGNMEAIKNFQKEYGDKASFFMIYTIDAHPFDSPSPYSPERKVWIAKNNTRDNVKAAQPKVYEQRVELARKWLKENSIEFPVLIDAPDNFYWKKFGQAPNMVYIISPGQTVFFKQAWFNKERLAQQFEDLKSEKLSAD
jgi:cytochrome oxidase Cu insertion factor (SCO1/SenC/PrrC family)